MARIESSALIPSMAVIVACGSNSHTNGMTLHGRTNLADRTCHLTCQTPNFDTNRLGSMSPLAINCTTLQSECVSLVPSSSGNGRTWPFLRRKHGDYHLAHVDMLSSAESAPIKSPSSPLPPASPLCWGTSPSLAHENLHPSSSLAIVFPLADQSK